jgi:hypothetical protein
VFRRRQVSWGGVREIGEHLLQTGVITVRRLGVGQDEAAVGEADVMAPRH